MKKGFTLIELISVIIILGVLALITTPIVLNIVEKTKEKAFLRSIDGVTRALAIRQLEDNSIENIVFNVKEGQIDPKLDIEGELEGNGFLTINSNGNIRLAITNNEICAKKEYADAQIILNYGQCDIEVEEEKNLDISGASIPQIDTSMIAVTYKDNKWVKADKKNVDKDYQWYDYDNGMWANMVVVRKNKKQEYQEKKLGDEVKLDDIVGFFVGIPCFSYRLTEGDGQRAFEIKFSDDPVEGYNFHPAFNWDDTNITGFWMAKFETTGSKDNITILPGVPAIKNTTLNNMYQSINKINEMKPIDEYNEVLSEIHLIKNEEWGAVTILSQSIYGRCKNDICEKVEKNTQWNTGYADKASTYDTLKGMLTSTTGNIYGVYDMNGCTWEFTMGTNKVSTIDKNMSTPYYTNYTDTGILGDLTTEDATAGWYDSDSNWLLSYRNWFIRGGDVNTTNSSIFWYSSDGNNGGFRNGFRLTYIIK